MTRTALPAPTFVRDARQKARDVEPENCHLCSRRYDWPALPCPHPGRVTVEQARSNPDDFIRYIEQNP